MHELVEGAVQTTPPQALQARIAARLDSTGIDGYFEGAPDLKVRQYLAAGARAVAVVYPLARSIWLHRPEGSPHLLTVGRLLEVPDVLPGWSIAVADVFATLDQTSG